MGRIIHYGELEQKAIISTIISILGRRKNRKLYEYCYKILASKYKTIPEEPPPFHKKSKKHNNEGKKQKEKSELDCIEKQLNNLSIEELYTIKRKLIRFIKNNSDRSKRRYNIKNIKRKSIGYKNSRKKRKR